MGALLSILLVATPVAVTLDDLPFAGDVGPNDTKAAATARILAALKKHAAAPIGFVVCGREPKELLAQWKDATLGNHSTEHKSLNALTLDAWTKDLLACDAQLKATPKYYRFPFLQEGKDPETRDAAAAVLKKNGYRNAQVSIDTSDWLLAGLYVDALKKEDKARAANIGRDYVMHVRLAAQRYRSRGQSKWRRNIAHVLLLHANALAADWLDALLAALKKDGFEFTTLDAALADPVYAEPEVYAGKIGLSWLYRITDTAAEQWKWDDAQTQKMSMPTG